jgi:two-component system alkaline phosphatase synthesis response regulator PhoP
MAVFPISIDRRQVTESAGMPTRVVAFDPSPEYRSVVGCLLEQTDAYELVECETATELSAAIAEAPPGLVLVSFADLPGGEDGLAELRRSVDAPIVAFVQDRDETKRALRGGADYDLPKPFDPEIFMVAMEAVMRRTSNSPATLLPTAGPAFVDGLRVYPDRRTVERDGRRQTLSHSEWQLFAFLIANPGRVFSRRELAAGAWGPGYATRVRQAELYVSRVRRKVERNPRSPQILETVRGRGYRFTAELTATPPATSSATRS